MKASIMTTIVKLLFFLLPIQFAGAQSGSTSQNVMAYTDVPYKKTSILTPSLILIFSSPELTRQEDIPSL